MITKTTTPIIEDKKLTGTKVEYRLFGILLYKKLLYVPDMKEFSASEYHII